MAMHPSQHMTTIQFANGFTAITSTSQWIAMLFDVLHPSQQEAIMVRIQEMSKAQQERPLVALPSQISHHETA